MFTPDDAFCGVDLDGCRDPVTGEIQTWAQEIIDATQSYAEISPSSTGVKIWVRGAWKGASHKKILSDVPHVCDKAVAIEVYDRGRYFAVTGQRLPGCNEIRDGQDMLDDLVEMYFMKPEGLHQSSPPLATVPRDKMSAIDRARLYLAKCPGAIEKQGGSNKTFWTAIQIVRGFDLDQETAFQLLLEWNPKCQPPWSEKELRHKVDGADKSAGNRGWHLNRQPPNRSSNYTSNGQGHANGQDEEQTEPRNGHSRGAATPPAPHSPEAEAGIIGACLTLGAIPGAAQELPVDAFHVAAHRAAWTAISTCHEEFGRVDHISVIAEMQRLNPLDKDAGRLVEELRQRTPEGAQDNFPRWVQIVQKLAHQRDMCQWADEVKRAALAGEDVATILDARPETQVASVERYPSFNSLAIDIMECNMHYLVEGLLVKGQPCIIGGAQKTCKTSLSIDLVLSLALGLRFLNKFQCARARVAIMSGESGIATIQETARRIARSKGYPLDNFLDAYFCFDLPTFGDQADEAHLRAFIEQNAIEVLIIDPAYLCMPIGDSASNLFIVGDMLKNISKIGQETGCTILICHHTRRGGKADPFVPPELMDIAWAGFAEWGRQWLLIGRREQYDPDQGGKHKLWLNVGGSAGHSGLWGVDIEEGTPQDPGGRRWEVAVHRASEVRNEAEDELHDRKESREDARRESRALRDMQRVLDAMQKLPKGETKRAIRTAAGISGDRMEAVLPLLMESGAIEPFAIKKGSVTYDGLRLIQNDRLTQREMMG